MLPSRVVVLVSPVVSGVVLVSRLQNLSHIQKKKLDKKTASWWKERSDGVKSPPLFKPKAGEEEWMKCVSVPLKRNPMALLSSRTGAVIGCRLRAFGWRAR